MPERLKRLKTQIIAICIFTEAGTLICKASALQIRIRSLEN